LSLRNFADKQMRYIAMNAYWEPLQFVFLPVAAGAIGGRLCFMDISLPARTTVSKEKKAAHADGSNYRVNPRSIILPL
jgi:hypothetical protein